MAATDRTRLHAALATARRTLLDARAPGGHWAGALSASALSTATAVTALSLAARESHPSMPHVPPRLLTRGLDWLAEHTNPDGGWGDTVKSLSNISTTALCWAAFATVSGEEARHREIVHRAERWLAGRSGGGPVLDVQRLITALIARYGKDRTFSVPILTMCALAGRLGEGAGAWRSVIPLPFELAAAPHQLFAALRLPVVSYALPALIAIGQARHHHRPTRNPVTRLLRNATRAGTLRKLEEIQPSSGGFLEATPLTSFVTMSLAASGQAGNSVTRKGAGFLLAAARPDGSWPIDTNLCTWVTTLSVNALGVNGLAETTPEEQRRIRGWLLAQQYRVEHPYTHAAPGGWAWTDLPGGVPDADDTAGALLALRNLGEPDVRTLAAAECGVCWLLDLQNSDGGIPTFCRGWTNLPFDRSSPDLTAHTLRAWATWENWLSPPLRRRVRSAMKRAVCYLHYSQRTDGSWLPLWFGNQHAPDDENPTYGTARVLHGLEGLAEDDFPGMTAMRNRSGDWLAAAQGSDGGWGGVRGSPPSVEETALAVGVLADFPQHAEATARGVEWLVQSIENGTWTQPSPIGFYFAKLWYFERLYPVIFTVGALERVASLNAGASQ